MRESAETVAAFATEITETRAFVRSFVTAILVRPGQATIPYTITKPPDSPICGGTIGWSNRAKAMVGIALPASEREPAQMTNSSTGPSKTD
jgi:hypothetical protein